MTERQIIVLKDKSLPLLSDHIFSHILNIGDPHLYNARPGRRRDEDFLETVLNKLTQIKNIANEKNCFSLITGDFFHTKTIDIKSEFINKIIKVLKEFNHKPLVLSGNHEKAEWKITDKDALSILKNTDLIDVLDGNGLVGKIIVEQDGVKQIIGIGGTCFGETIPYDLTSFIGMEENSSFRDDEEIEIYKEALEKQKGQKIILIDKSPKEKSNVELHNRIKSLLGVDKIIWITHHDLAFNEVFPFSRPLHPIDGVDIMINGHMHSYKKPVKKDLTQCYNPGNIVRLKIDEIDNIPSVWIYSPFDNEKEYDINGLEIEKLHRIVLKYKPYEEVFSLEGKNIIESKKDLNIDTGNFVKLLLSDQHQEKTDEAVFIKEKLDEIKGSEEISDPAYNYILSLISEVVETQIKNK